MLIQPPTALGEATHEAKCFLVLPLAWGGALNSLFAASFYHGVSKAPSLLLRAGSL